MNIQVPAPRACARSSEPSRADAIERRLVRFHPRYAHAVRSLAARHSSLADLALAFPALLFALAAPRRGGAAERAIAATLVGRPLKDVAKEMMLPMWLRRLPPEAFERPIEPLPTGAPFARRIANHLPRSPKRAAAWLRAVEHSARWGGEDVAVWVAREFARDPSSTAPKILRLVCLWAWMSTRTGLLASALSQRRWSPDMRFASAADAARVWIEDVRTACVLGTQGLADGWLEPAEIDGLRFVPLLKAQELIEEARAMRNCVRTYRQRLQTDRVRLWSLRRGEERVATIEIGGDYRGVDAYLTVRQVRTRGNGNLAPEAQRAVLDWLRSQPLRDTPEPLEGRAPVDRNVWISLWRPYWIAQGRIPDWLPLSSALPILSEIERSE
jgi:hypothetical protein